MKTKRNRPRAGGRSEGAVPVSAGFDRLPFPNHICNRPVGSHPMSP